MSDVPMYVQSLKVSDRVVAMVDEAAKRMQARAAEAGVSHAGVNRSSVIRSMIVYLDSIFVSSKTHFLADQLLLHCLPTDDYVRFCEFIVSMEKPEKKKPVKKDKVKKAAK